MSFEKLYNHRTNCYFLTDYKDVCYPQMNVSVYFISLLKFPVCTSKLTHSFLMRFIKLFTA